MLAAVDNTNIVLIAIQFRASPGGWCSVCVCVCVGMCMDTFRTNLSLTWHAVAS